MNRGCGNVSASHVDIAKLCSGIRTAIENLATGFLQHPDNASFRAQIPNDSTSAQRLFQQTTYAVLRLVMWFVMHEHRNFDCLLNSPVIIDIDDRQLCIRHLVTRYCAAVYQSDGRKPAGSEESGELWSSTTKLLACVPALRDTPYRLGGIFLPDRCPEIDALCVGDNHFISVLTSILNVGFATDFEIPSGITPSHLGLVYPYLLQFSPHVDIDARQFKLLLPPSKHQSTRKISGSYYTPDALIQTVIERTVGPLVNRIINTHVDNPINASIELQNLRIVDPACGCGHFIVAAARYLAFHLACCRCDGPPSSAEMQRALFDVLTNCIYGVDIDPVAVDLCQLNLWWHANDPCLDVDTFNPRIRHGNPLIGAPPDITHLDIARSGIPEAGISETRWTGTCVDNNAERLRANRVLERKHTPDAIQEEGGRCSRSDDATAGSKFDLTKQKWFCDLWCASFFLPKRQGPVEAFSLTNTQLGSVHDVNSNRTSAASETGFVVDKVDEFRTKYAFFHWHVEFPDVFSRGGFDAVVGNPPWIAHVGRAAKRLDPHVALFYCANYAGFSRYRTTHGLFASVMPTWLRIGGQLGLVVPAGICDLDGYEPTRRAHDILCDFREELIDFGEGRFTNVTQPCVALVSERTHGGRCGSPPGSPWPLERPDLCAEDVLLMKQLAKLPRIAPELFGERGLQSDRAIGKHIRKCSAPHGRFQTPLREGTDVREFELLSARYHVDRNALAAHSKRIDAMANVPVVIRQTARYPIAALSDGLAFRNSLLAGFINTTWSAPALVALLNSSLIRWHHYHSFRDARQPMLPQVKIGHLRQIPVPSSITDEALRALDALGRNETLGNGRGVEQNDAEEVLGIREKERILRRERIDRLVAGMYQLSQEQHERVTEWHRQIQGKSR